MNNLEKAEELRANYDVIDKLLISDELKKNLKKVIKQKAKALKEKIESEGCGEYLNGYDVLCNKNKICVDCQKAIKICEEILK